MADDVLLDLMFIFKVRYFPVMHLQYKLQKEIGGPRQIYLDSRGPAVE